MTKSSSPNKLSIYCSYTQTTQTITSSSPANLIATLLTSSSKFNSIIIISFTQGNHHHHKFEVCKPNTTGASPTRDTTRGRARTQQGTETMGEVKGGQGKQAQSQGQTEKGEEQDQQRSRGRPPRSLQ